MHEAPGTRPSLLLRLRGERDEQAWAEFLGLYEPLILRLMRGRGLQDSDARDATQQVLLRSSRAIDSYESDGESASFRRWLFRVARNVVVTFLTRQSRQPRLLADGPLAETCDAAPPKSLESNQFDEEFQRQVLAWGMGQVRHEFRDSTWQAFVETSVNGRTIAEVARELGMSPGSVYVARSRIIARLRTKVAEWEVDQ